MSRYHQSSNPFEDDDDGDDGDFVIVNKTAKPAPSQQGGQPQNKMPYTNKSDSFSSAGHNRPQGKNLYSSGSGRPEPSFSASSHNRPQKNPYSSDSFSYHPDEDNPFEERRQQLMRKIENSENNQLESTQRALASIYDSEAMGVATAEELVRQGETLDNIENKTDSMQQSLKTSQKHLNNIKSVFGGIKNWWTGGNKPISSSKPSEENANTRLRETIEKTEKTKPDVRGFYEDDDDLDTKFMAKAPKQSGQYTMIQPVTRSAREEEVDHNLGLMCDGMSKLKGLAIGLGDEIERQNEQLDRINGKVDRTDELLTHQNTQMRRILRK